MPKVRYITKTFSPERIATIHTINAILEGYAAQGYDLTLRQLYYQFVSRGLIENKNTEYKNLGSLVNDARLAGLIDWDHITDRTRNLVLSSHWENPAEIVRSCAEQFQIDKWKRQPNYVEVWVEKDALVGVLQVACEPLDVPYFSCRGYTSQSEMWSAAMRLLRHHDAGQELFIIHLGDHDPSGIDMTRDIEERLNLFLSHHARATVEVNRVALHMDQIRSYFLPPNPAKLTDSRAGGYVRQFGRQSWELDALEPAVITELITEAVKELRSDTLWRESARVEKRYRTQLQQVARTLSKERKP